MKGADVGRSLVIWMPEAEDRAAEQDLQKLLQTTPLRLVQPARGTICLREPETVLQGIASVLMPVVPRRFFRLLKEGDYHDPVLRLLLVARQREIPLAVRDFWPDGTLPEPVGQRIRAEKELLQAYGIAIRGTQTVVPAADPAARKNRIVTRELLCAQGAAFVPQSGDIVTPLARDYAKEHGIPLTPDQK